MEKKKWIEPTIIICEKFCALCKTATTNLLSDVRINQQWLLVVIWSVSFVCVKYLLFSPILFTFSLFQNECQFFFVYNTYLLHQTYSKDYLDGFFLFSLHQNKATDAFTSFKSIWQNNTVWLWLCIKKAEKKVFLPSFCIGEIERKKKRNRMEKTW